LAGKRSRWISTGSAVVLKHPSGSETFSFRRFSTSETKGQPPIPFGIGGLPRADLTLPRSPRSYVHRRQRRAWWQSALPSNSGIATRIDNRGNRQSGRADKTASATPGKQQRDTRCRQHESAGQGNGGIATRIEKVLAQVTLFGGDFRDSRGARMAEARGLEGIGCRNAL
jgi:hypothetical protein